MQGKKQRGVKREPDSYTLDSFLTVSTLFVDRIHGCVISDQRKTASVDIDDSRTAML